MAMQIISLVLNFLFAGGFIITLINLKSVKQEASGKAQKAVAEAEKEVAAVKKDEIQNVEAAIKIWREMAESMAERHDETMREVQALRCEVNRLRLINNRIVRLLDKITPDNLQTTVDKIKQEMQNDENMAHGSTIHPAVNRV